jgi:hypothetical protein
VIEVACKARENVHSHAQAAYEQEAREAAREAAEVFRSVYKVKYTETLKQSKGTLDDVADVFSASTDNDDEFHTAPTASLILMRFHVVILLLIILLLLSAL